MRFPAGAMSKQVCGTPSWSRYCSGQESGSAVSSRGDGCGTTCAACWGRWAGRTAGSCPSTRNDYGHLGSCIDLRNGSEHAPLDHAAVPGNSMIPDRVRLTFRFGILLGLAPCRKSSALSSTAVCPVRLRGAHRACWFLRGPVGHLAQKVFVLRVASHVATFTALGVDDNPRTATEPWSSIWSRWADGDLKKEETGPRNPSKKESPLQSIVFGKIAGPEFLCSQRGGLQRDHRAPPPVGMNSQ